MTKLDLEGISMNWLHFPRNVDLVELAIIDTRKYKRLGKKRTKNKVIAGHMAREVRRIIQEAMFGE